MANLPANRTKLQAAVSDQSQSITPASGKANREAMIEVYDTIDLLNQKVDNLVPAGAVTPVPPYNVYRQAIINGNFDVWQRGTSVNFSSTEGNTIGYGCDRWWFQGYNGVNPSGNIAFTVSQQVFSPGQSDVPNNPRFFTRFGITALAPLGPNSGVIRMTQKIEGVGLFSGRTVTLSFWAKSNTARSIAVVISQIFGTGGSPSADNHFSGTTINLTTAWQKFTVTVTVPSVAGKTTGSDTNDSLDVQFLVYKQDNSIFPTPSGTVGTWATGDFDFAQIQLNDGDAALPFQPKSFAEELALCQRYYEQSYDYGFAPGTSINNGMFMTSSTNAASPAGVRWILGAHPRFRVEKRIAPTVSLWNVAGTKGIWTIGGADRASSVYAFKAGFWVQNNTGTTVTPAVGDSYGHYAADAEI